MIDKRILFILKKSCESCPNLAVDDLSRVPYHFANTGKEVIQKYMSSNHSEVAAA